MEATSRYNKSKIMKAAHVMYKSCKAFGRTFGSCLKHAWASEKNMVELEEKRQAFQRELEESWTSRNTVCTHVGMSSLYASGVYSGD